MHSLTANIDDSESLLDQLTLDINKIRVRILICFFKLIYKFDLRKIYIQVH